MMFKTAALVLAATSLNTASASKTLCYDYGDSLNFNLGRGECTPRVIMKKLTQTIRPTFKKLNSAAKKGEKCSGGLHNELMALTATTHIDDVAGAIEAMCEEALAKAADEVDESDWEGRVDANLEEYFEGNGFLNLETGNFRQSTEQFTKRGGYNSFITISEDPRKNDHYPTTEASYATGEAVNELFEGDAKTTYLRAPGDFDATCDSNTVMCCWSRDRQYFDQNGDCSHRDCARQDPGDNTDLCWTEEDDEVFPYPGSKSEGALHCHGISWANDTNDINTKAKFNNLFYVSMYDHMYKRGYVESITNDKDIAGTYPMCGCIEEMAPVARADCQMVEANAEYTTTIDDDKLLQINFVENSFKMQFEACEGYRYKDNFGPEDYDLSSKELKAQDNDLAAFVFRQYLEGKIEGDQVEMVEEVLIGYKNPEVNNSDKKREEACEAAFLDRYPDMEYEERELEVEADGEFEV